LQAYAAKKSKKPALIAKTSVLLDVKPWDDETPMDKLKECVKSIEMDGLVWGADKFVPVGYGINKLQVRKKLQASAQLQLEIIYFGIGVFTLKVYLTLILQSITFSC
jgi:hypothetical protein